jgi:hypothetical protein
MIELQPCFKKKKLKCACTMSSLHATTIKIGSTYLFQNNDPIVLLSLSTFYLSFRKQCVCGSILPFTKVYARVLINLHFSICKDRMEILSWQTQEVATYRLLLLECHKNIL